MAMLIKALRNHSYPIFIPLLACLILNGCATTQYGNFIQNASLDASHAMAEDAAVQIGRLYPPATTQFTLVHPVKDAFGQMLTEKLRVAGFAVQEAFEPSIEQSLFAVPQPQEEQKAGIRLSYIVDQSEHIYHTNIQIGDRHLSRAFMAQDNDFYPAGHWVSRQ